MVLSVVAEEPIEVIVVEARRTEIMKKKRIKEKEKKR